MKYCGHILHMYCIDYNNNHKVSPNRILLHSFACNIKDLKSDHSQHLRRYTPTEKVYTYWEVHTYWEGIHLLRRYTPTEKVHTYWEGIHLLRRYTSTEKVYTYWEGIHLLRRYTPTEKVHTYWEGTHLLRRSTFWLFELDLMALPAKSHWLLVVCLKILLRSVLKFVDQTSPWQMFFQHFIHEITSREGPSRPGTLG